MKLEDLVFVEGIAVVEGDAYDLSIINADRQRIIDGRWGWLCQLIGDTVDAQAGEGTYEVVAWNDDNESISLDGLSSSYEAMKPYETALFDNTETSYAYVPEAVLDTLLSEV